MSIECNQAPKQTNKKPSSISLDIKLPRETKERTKNRIYCCLNGHISFLLKNTYLQFTDSA